MTKETRTNVIPEARRKQESGKREIRPSRGDDVSYPRVFGLLGRRRPPAPLHPRDPASHRAAGRTAGGVAPRVLPARLPNPHRLANAGLKACRCTFPGGTI